MNIINLLKADHKKVKEIFSEIEETSSKAEKKRTKLFETLHQELAIHEKIEETIFYPRLKKEKEAKDIVLESYEEHHVMDLLLQELAELEPGAESWLPKLIVLKEVVEHHVKEEEKELFPQTQKLLPKEELETMGMEATALKEENS